MKMFEIRLRKGNKSIYLNSFDTYQSAYDYAINIKEELQIPEESEVILNEVTWEEKVTTPYIL